MRDKKNITSDNSNSSFSGKNNIVVKCDVCDIESIFKNEKEAFLGGWMFKGVAAGLTICFCPACSGESII